MPHSWEIISESRHCQLCKSLFHIYEKDRQMIEILSPSFLWHKYLFPLPNECPNCRRQKRHAWRNEHKLYRRTCSFSGKKILSWYTPHVTFPVYESDIWHSDVWNALDYGKNFDFSRPFFEQFQELKNTVPHFSRSILNLENSEYSSNAGFLKNCYLCFNADFCEDSYYSIFISHIKNCVDCYSIDHCENCYQCVDLVNCQKMYYSQDCKDCFNGYFLKNCINCKDCFLSKNQVNKQYVFLNKQLDKVQYEAKVKDYLKEHSFSQLESLFSDFAQQFPEKCIHGNTNEDVSGDYITNGKSVHASFNILNCEEIRYSSEIKEHATNIMDVDSFGWHLENCYQWLVLGHSTARIFFSVECRQNVSDLYYCFSCIKNTRHCFGCVGLSGQEYCILNKQYTKEAYEALIPKIIEHMMKTNPLSVEGGVMEWGQFFPPDISPYGYNETTAILYFPLTQEEATKRWFTWSTYEEPFPKVEKIIPANKLPKNIDEIPDDILHWAIECEVTKKPYRIIKQELDFYRLHHLPLPKKHPEQRHKQRFLKRNPWNTLFIRKCDTCALDITTTFWPTRKEKILCETCYHSTIY
jgi:hypothetical protein